MSSSAAKSGISIVGPTLPHLHSIGMDRTKLILATAYYSRRALMSIPSKASHIRFFCRLNGDSPVDWIKGIVDPPALLDFAKLQIKHGSTIEICVSPTAHAKVYIGSDAAIIGSANLSLRGFGGGQEIIYKIINPNEIRQLRKAVDIYAQDFTDMSLEFLEGYIAKYKALVEDRSKSRTYEDRLPPFRRNYHGHLGDYDDFQVWLGKQTSDGAQEILERGRGKDNLSGHIFRNFYGLRQFILTFPETLKRFSAEDPDKYKLSKDEKTENNIKQFVHLHAIDEENFLVTRWKTYLPVECGGKAGKHGGTIGNLNRMLPLVAQYLVDKYRGRSH